MFHPSSLLLILILGFASTIACASPPPPGSSSLDPGAPSEVSHVFPNIESAIEAAFLDARQSEGPDGQARLRMGTIRHVGGGYVWSAPITSREPVWSSAPMRVRLALESRDVAVYVVHPRSGRPEVDRANETPNRSERALVDRSERPLFLLTPSRKVVRLEVGGEPDARTRAGRGAVGAAR